MLRDVLVDAPLAQEPRALRKQVQSVSAPDISESGRKARVSVAAVVRALVDRK
jgi:hypothetical protein